MVQALALLLGIVQFQMDYMLGSQSGRLYFVYQKLTTNPLDKTEVLVQPFLRQDGFGVVDQIGMVKSGSGHFE